MLTNPMVEIFQKDHLYINSEQLNMIYQFMQINPFLGKLYTKNQRDQLIKILYYRKIAKRQNINFDGSKRLAVIILLCGQIHIIGTSQPTNKNNLKDKKLKQIRSRLQSNIKIGVMSQQNSTISIDYDCEIHGNPQEDSHILFIPNNLYQAFLQKNRNEKSQRIVTILKQKFPQINRRQLQEIATVCNFQQYRIHRSLYELNDKPEYAYILLSGNIKLQRYYLPGKLDNSVIISPTSIFGERDILFAQRETTASCFSAYAQVLMIPKRQFIKLAQSQLPQLFKISPSKEQIEFKQRLKKIASMKIHKEQQKERFPLINSTKLMTNQEQQSFEAKIISNSHTLLDLGKSLPKKNANRPRLRSPNLSKNLSEDTIQRLDPFETKYNLFLKLRPNPIIIDLQHRLI